MRIEKLRKVELCFITGFFIKPLKIIIIFSSVGLFVHKIFNFSGSSFEAQFSFLDIRMMQEISKREIWNGKLMGMANYNIYVKNNFNLLVMNVTQNKCTLLTYMYIHDTQLKLIIREVCSFQII